MKVAVVVMPWWNVEVPPLSPANVKAFLRAEGAQVDGYYLNVRMYSRIGGLALRLGKTTELWAEWLFGYHLFGPGGSGELAERPRDMLRIPAFQDLLREVELDGAGLERLVARDIPAFLEDCLSQVPWGDYGLVCFSSSYWSHTASLALSRAVKDRFPSLKIAFEGENVEAEMGLAILRGCEWIDYVVDGESEQALSTLVRNLASSRPYERVPRVSFRRSGRVFARDPESLPLIDINRLPVPDHGDYFAELERAGTRGALDPVATFEGSRGCWWGRKQHCTFCGLVGAVMTYRVKDPELVLRDILELQRRHRCRKLQAFDYIMAIEHLQGLLPRLATARRELGADWNIFSQLKSNLTSAQIDALAEAGVSTIQPGIESFSTPILNLTRKGVRAIQNIQTIKLAAERGLDAIWNILFGFPGEDIEEYARMARTVLDLTHLPPPYSAKWIRIDRFSPYHKDWRKFGLRKPSPRAAYRYVFPEPRITIEEAAYYFEMDERDRREDDPHLVRLRQAVDFWRRTWLNNVFAYAGGLDFVEVYDSRPLSIGGGCRLQRHLLEGVEAVVFRSCRTIRSIKEIEEDCRQAGASPRAGQVARILGGMKRRHWLFEEDGRFLSLAVPGARLAPAQKAALDSMMRATREWLRARPGRRLSPLEAGAKT